MFVVNEVKHLHSWVTYVVAYTVAAEIFDE